MTVESGRVEGFLSAHAITTIHYLIRKQLGDAKARKLVTSLLTVFHVTPVDDSVLRDALRLKGPDFEDAVTCIAALRAGTDYVVTRDPKGFRHSPVPTVTPEVLLPLL